MLVVVVGLAMLSLTPRLWRGTRAAAALALVGLGLLGALNIVKGHYDEATVELCLGLALALGRGEFRVGCRNRPRLMVVSAALGAWALTYCAMLVAPLVPGSAGRALAAALHHSNRPRLALVGLAAATQRGLVLAAGVADRDRRRGLGAGGPVAAAPGRGRQRSHGA